jgi:hypothetical protein
MAVPRRALAEDRRGCCRADPDPLSKPGNRGEVGQATNWP